MKRSRFTEEQIILFYEEWSRSRMIRADGSVSRRSALCLCRIASRPRDPWGTLAPWALVASLPFAPEILLPTLEYCIHQAKLKEYNRYGFKASFNPTRVQEPLWLVGITVAPRAQSRADCLNDRKLSDRLGLAADAKQPTYHYRIAARVLPGVVYKWGPSGNARDKIERHLQR